MSVVERVRPYLALFRARFRVLLQYRAAAVAGVATQLLFGLVYVMVYTAFYASSDVPPPVPLAQIVTMTWLGQAMLGMLPWNGDQEVIAALRKGDIAYELVRPLELYDHWFMRSVAMRLAPTLLRAVPQFIIALYLMPPQWRMTPPGGPALCAWLACAAGALLLASATSNLISISFLWTVAGDGVLRIVAPLVTILSGMQVPLLLYPAWAQSLLRFLPFAGMHELPARVFAGILPPSAAFWVLPFQLVWTLAMVLFGKALIRRGLRRVVLQGG